MTPPHRYKPPNCAWSGGRHCKLSPHFAVFSLQTTRLHTTSIITIKSAVRGTTSMIPTLRIGTLWSVVQENRAILRDGNRPWTETYTYRRMSRPKTVPDRRLQPGAENNNNNNIIIMIIMQMIIFVVIPAKPLREFTRFV